MPETHQDLYMCTRCGVGFNEPKCIRVCQGCGGIKTIKLTSALIEVAKAQARIASATEGNDFEEFKKAKTNLVEIGKKLEPPSSH